MAWDVHIHVCFPCRNNDGVAELARRHLNGLSISDDGEQAAKWFLEDLSERTGENKGPKGGLSLWGMVGNYTNGDSFCECLKPFWKDLLGEGHDGGPCSHERIVVFLEPEQSEAATAYQIGWDEPYEDERYLVIKKCDRLPFSWNQA